MIFRLAKKGDEKELLRLVGNVLRAYGLNLEPEGADELAFNKSITSL